MMMGFGAPDGKPTEMLMDYYEERAKGGTGLILTEITRVNDDHGAAAFNQLAMSHDYHIEPMREFAERIHRHGAKFFVQLHHPGRREVLRAAASPRQTERRHHGAHGAPHQYVQQGVQVLSQARL